jgi:hypothetical protein
MQDSVAGADLVTELRHASTMPPRTGGERVGYVVSRTSGLPGDHDDDVGNWRQPLGLASLLGRRSLSCSRLQD